MLRKLERMLRYFMEGSLQKKLSEPSLSHRLQAVCSLDQNRVFVP